MEPLEMEAKPHPRGWRHFTALVLLVGTSDLACRALLLFAEM